VSTSLAWRSHHPLRLTLAFRRGLFHGYGGWPGRRVLVCRLPRRSTPSTTDSGLSS